MRLEYWGNVINKRKYSMARNNRNFRPVEFVRCTLTSDDKKNFSAWVAQNDDSLFDLELAVLHDGYKISYSYDEEREAVVCTFIPKADSHINHGYGLSSFGKTQEQALHVNVFKTQHMAKNGEWSTLDTSGDDFG